MFPLVVVLADALINTMFRLVSKLPCIRAFHRGMASWTQSVDPKKTALVLIEFQNEFAADGGKLYPAVKEVMAANNMLTNSAKTVKAARELGVKIFHVPISFSPDFRELPSPYGILGNVKGGECFVKGSWGADFVDAMRPVDGDIIVQGKSGLCGFESTNLQFLLGQHHVEYVAIGGFLTNCCVESSMRAAYEKGYKVITLTDCTASTSPAEQVSHEFAFTFALTNLIVIDTSSRLCKCLFRSSGSCNKIHFSYVLCPPKTYRIPHKHRLDEKLVV